MSSRTLAREAVARHRGRRGLSRRAAVIAAAGIATMAGSGAIVANAAVPEFPNNVVVFPDRDFITVEGYQDHIGETATLEVYRGDEIIGSAQGVIAAGDVAFEINHPGGVCWGEGTNLKVTPDIRAGDVAKIRFGSEAGGETTVQDAAVTQRSVLNGTTLTVSGHVGAGVDKNQMEQRIVAPDLADTDVGRRDIRAVPGAMTAAPKGGYSSQLTFSGDTFTATYEFDNADTAQIAAAATGERAMAWQVQDADGNRQGLTISEFGELGGPGMGGCPAGPADQGAPQPGTASVIRAADGTSMQVNWEPATPAPGAEAVTGYSVQAIAKTASASGERTTIGVRTAADAKKTTITGLDGSEAYDVEVRSIAGPRMSEAYTTTVDAPPSTAPDPGTVTLPKITATPAPDDGKVVETAEVRLESDGQLFYTTGDTPVITGDMPSDAANLYSGPIPITEQTTLNVAAFDKAGNHTALTGVYGPPAGPTEAPAAPTGLTGTPGELSVALKWAATDTTITSYRVQAYTRTSATAPLEKSGTAQETTSKSLTMPGLTAGKEYWFTVSAKNAKDWGAESDKAGPYVPAGDRITIGTARWKSGDFRVSGTGSVVGTATDPVTVRVHPAKADGTIDTSVTLASGPVTAAAAPATGGEYSLRVRNGAAPARNPGRIFVTSSKGGVAGPFTVASG